jgi:hypothetical protein
VLEQRHCVGHLFGGLFFFHSARHSSNSVKPDLLVFLSLSERMLAQYLKKYPDRFFIRL